MFKYDEFYSSYDVFFFLHCYSVGKYISLENNVLFYVTDMGHWNLNISD